MSAAAHIRVIVSVMVVMLFMLVVMLLIVMRAPALSAVRPGNPGADAAYHQRDRRQRTGHEGGEHSGDKRYQRRKPPAVLDERAYILYPSFNHSKVVLPPWIKAFYA